MKRTFIFATSVVLAAILAIFSGAGVRKVIAQMTPVKTYQVWTHKTNSLNEAWDEYTARRSNGDTLQTNSDNGVSTLRFPARGIEVIYSSRTGKMMTWGDGNPLSPRDSSTCSEVGPVIPGDTKEILGFRALHVVYVSTSTGKSGAKKEDHFQKWVVPELSCFPVEEESTFIRDGEVYHRESTTVTKIVLGEPPEDVFKIPAGAVESLPSAFFAALGQGGAVDPAISQKQDDFYNKQKAQRAAFRLP
jgi:hypothetical protein